ncbi:hypothetical protein M3Y94_01315900 [Aphelenchoides besseyi]|nr:hypothetical protein M3Y94_01315900 [Aphelenchoides besseyi]
MAIYNCNGFKNVATVSDDAIVSWTNNGLIQIATVNRTHFFAPIRLAFKKIQNFHKMELAIYFYEVQEATFDGNNWIRLSVSDLRIEFSDVRVCKRYYDDLIERGFAHLGRNDH